MEKYKIFKTEKFEKKILTKVKTLEKLEELNKIGRYSNEIYEYFKKEVK